MQMPIFGRLLCAVAIVTSGYAFAADTKSDKPKAPPKPEPVVIEDMAAHIEEMLKKKSEVAYLDTQLTDIVSDLELRFKVDFEIDKVALQSEGKGEDTTFSLFVQNISLASILNRLLTPHGLAWTVVDEGILITTRAGDAQHTLVRVYGVGDLAGADEAIDYEELINLLTVSVDPQSWRQEGGTSGTVAQLTAKKALVITQTYGNHKKIGELLQQLSEK